MSTTRHLVNRRRRLATSPSRAAVAPVSDEETAEETTEETTAPPGLREPETVPEQGQEPEPESDGTTPHNGASAPASPSSSAPSPSC